MYLRVIFKAILINTAESAWWYFSRFMLPVSAGAVFITLLIRAFDPESFWAIGIEGEAYKRAIEGVRSALEGNVGTDDFLGQIMIIGVLLLSVFVTVSVLVEVLQIRKRGVRFGVDFLLLASVALLFGPNVLITVVFAVLAVATGSVGNAAIFTPLALLLVGPIYSAAGKAMRSFGPWVMGYPDREKLELSGDLDAFIAGKRTESPETGKEE